MGYCGRLDRICHPWVSGSVILRFALYLFLGWIFSETRVLAQVVPFAGVVGGVATLSADARSLPTSQGLSVSLYKPENGLALNFFAGAHLNPYLSIQASYIWNRNDLTLSSSSPASNSFFEERRTSSQNALILDVMAYFRPLKSRLRPYLSVGAGPVRFSSARQAEVAMGGTPLLPQEHFSSVRPALRAAVGIDVRLAHHLALRYTFSETIRHNDISAQLSPPGQRSLANFQNLFGVAFHF
jgi:outer membrane protein with beta-barrel domain